MKKLYILFFVAISTFGFSQTVVISTVVDGTLPGDGCSGSAGSSSPKIAELYVSGTVDFTNYRFQTESNGAVDEASITWSSGLDLTPLGTVTNAFVYLVGSGTDTFMELYPSITLPTGLTSGNLPNANGNDAYRIAIYDAPTAGNLISVIDQFGNPLDLPVNDYSAAWCYQDSYAKRNNGVGPNAGAFVTSSFTYGGNGAFVAPNNTCEFLSNAINLGSFTLGLNQNAIAGLKVYPNPVVNGTLYISTQANAERTVQIFDILGKQVLNKVTSTEAINVSNLKSGVYIVKISEEGKVSSRKLVIN